MMPDSLLERIPLFKNFNLSERRYLTAFLKKQVIKKGAILFRKGDNGNTCYFIIRGRIKITLNSKNEGEITLAIVTDGDFFGEMALLDGMPRSADAIAVETTQLYALNRKDFLSFLFSNKHANKSILYSLSMRLRRADKLLGEMTFLNAAARLSIRLLELVETQGKKDEGTGSIRITITQKELSSLVGVSRESVNRMLKELCTKGVLSTSRNTIFVKNLEYLVNPGETKK